MIFIGLVLPPPGLPTFTKRLIAEAASTPAVPSTLQRGAAGTKTTSTKAPQAVEAAVALSSRSLAVAGPVRRVAVWDPSPPLTTPRAAVWAVAARPPPPPCTTHQPPPPVVPMVVPPRPCLSPQVTGAALLLASIIITPLSTMMTGIQEGVVIVLAMETIEATWAEVVLHPLSMEGTSTITRHRLATGDGRLTTSRLPVSMLLSPRYIEIIFSKFFDTLTWLM